MDVRILSAENGRQVLLRPLKAQLGVRLAHHGSQREWAAPNHDAKDWNVGSFCEG